LSAVLLGVAAGGIAYAAIPDSNGVIRGCYLKKLGVLRVIDPATQQCSSLEVAISWNQTGPQGVKGDKGDPGTNGTNGTDGAPCLPSNPACVGPKGDKGDKGDPGDSGTPSGAVMNFNLTACPSGWAALTDAQGRYIVGTAPGQAVGGTVGSALSFSENRPAGRHAHALVVDENDPYVAFATTFRGIIDSTGLTESPGSVFDYVAAPGESTVYWHYSMGATNSAARSGGVEGTPAPYIQLLVCQKS
jgi:hypothetical protein